MVDLSTVKVPPRAVTARLAQVAKVPVPLLIDCIKFLLGHALELRRSWRPPGLHNPATLAKKWQPIAAHLAHAEKGIAELTTQERGWFDHILVGRLLPDGEGRPLAYYVGILQQLRAVAEIAQSSVIDETRAAHRPRSKIGSRGWTIEEAFAADVYFNVRQIEGKLSANKNDGGSLHIFLDRLEPYSGICPPSPRALQRVATLVDNKYGGGH